MKNTHQRIETVSNVAIIIVALALGVAMTNRYFFSGPTKASSPETIEIKAGTILPVSEVDWSRSDKTLIMALSATCRFCTESAPFYQKLTQQKAGRDDLRIVGVLPQSADEATRYLTEHKIVVDEIKQKAPAGLSVKGTPTLIIVDRTGVILDSWSGKLPADKETEVLTRFFSEKTVRR